MVAGIAFRKSIDISEFTIQSLDDLRQYENQWNPINGPPVKIDDWQGKTVLINFWASWCPPCIEEMPLLDRINTEFSDQDFQIVGFAVDYEDPARQFLVDHQIRFPSIVSAPDAMDEMIRALGNKDGVLPYSVAFSKSGEVKEIYIGPLNEGDLLKLTELN